MKKREKERIEEREENSYLAREGKEYRMRSALFYENVALLAFDCRFPAPEGEDGRKKIAAFYKDLANATAAYITKRLFPDIVRAYEGRADGRARRAFPRVRYLADFCITQDGNGFFSVRRKTRVFSAGREIFVHEECEVFSLARGLLCPIRFLRENGCHFAAKKRFSRHTGRGILKKLLFLAKRTKGEFYLQNNKIHLLTE